jgi:hypothetical protein
MMLLRERLAEANRGGGAQRASMLTRKRHVRRH